MNFPTSNGFYWKLLDVYLLNYIPRMLRRHVCVYDIAALLITPIHPFINHVPYVRPSNVIKPWC